MQHNKLLAVTNSQIGARNIYVYLRNDSLQGSLSQLTQDACFLVEGN